MRTKIAPLTGKQIAAILDLRGKYSSETAAHYKSYYQYICELVKKFSFEFDYSYSTRWVSATGKDNHSRYIEKNCTIKIVYTNGRVTGESNFVVPANNYYCDKILCLLRESNNGKLRHF